MSVEVSDKLDRLPPELLVKIGSYLPGTTINSLKCVNKRFNKFFKDDIFFLQYLYYPEKHFECDLRSNPVSQDVRDILKEIADGNVTKFLGYFKLQRAHLQNWVSGQYQSVDIIQILPNKISSIQQMVHFGEHWVFFSLREQVQVWNITARPNCLLTVSVGVHAGLRLLPNGKMLVKDYSLGSGAVVMAVYEFENQPCSLKLQYRFLYDMESKLDEGDQAPVKRGFNDCHVVMKDLFIGSDGNNTAFQMNALHVWNLSSGEKLGAVSLDTSELLQDFVDFVKLKTNKDIRASKFQHCKLECFPGEFPNLVVVFIYPTNHLLRKLSQVNIFNVKKMKFTHLITQSCYYIFSCYMYSDKVCVEELVNSKGNRLCTSQQLSIYSLQTPTVRDSLEVLVYRKPITLITYLALSSHQYIGTSVFYKNSIVLVKCKNKLLVFNLDNKSNNLLSIEVQIEKHFAILGFIEPKLLLMYNMNQNPYRTEVKVYNIISGQKICAWDKVNINGTKFLNYYKHLEFPFKILLNLKNRQYLRVYNF